MRKKLLVVIFVIMALSIAAPTMAAMGFCDYARAYNYEHNGLNKACDMEIQAENWLEANF